MTKRDKIQEKLISEYSALIKWIHTFTLDVIKSPHGRGLLSKIDKLESELQNLQEEETDILQCIAKFDSNESDEAKARYFDAIQKDVKKLMSELQNNDDKGEFNPPKSEIIEDGFGSTWSRKCPVCGRLSMQVVRPGKVQCKYCG